MNGEAEEGGEVPAGQENVINNYRIKTGGLYCYYYRHK
jgi:hypothetical protein